MKTHEIHIGTVPIAYARYSHYCTETSGNSKRWLRDDFNVKEIKSSQVSIFSKVDHTNLPGFPFGQTEKSAPDGYKKYTLLVNEVLYTMEEITQTSDQLNENSIVHYIISPFKLRVHSIGAKSKVIREKLSPRETEVLVLISKGHSMTSIAKQLYLSPYTIDSHRLNLCKKLKVRRTTELAVWAYKLGLLEYAPLAAS